MVHSLGDIFSHKTSNLIEMENTKKSDSISEGDGAVSIWCSYRFLLSVIGFFGMMHVIALRVNVSVAIVCMVNHTATRHHISHVEPLNGSVHNNATYRQINDEAQCAENTGGKLLEDGEFAWGKEIQGHILGSFYYGYLISQIPGGILAERFGAKRVFASFIFLAAVATFLGPLMARLSHIAFIISRVFVGIGTGITYPVMHSLFARWAPPLERSTLAGFCYAGSLLGTVVTLPLSGALCRYGFGGGWPSVFYITGMSTVVWLLVWMVFVSDLPENHPRISERERNYILKSLQGQLDDKKSERSFKKPWLKIFTSLPVWAIIVANVTCDWGYYTFLSNMPIYMHEVLKFDIQQNGLFSALPFLAMWIVMIVAPIITDLVRSKRIFSTTVVRKLCDNMGKIIGSAAVIVLAFLDCTQAPAAIALMCIGVSLGAVQMCGFGFNHMDIAPRFAGTLFGISNTVACISGFLVPYIVAVLTPHQTQAEWQRVFFLTAAVYAVGGIFYAIFASGELQPWASGKDENVENAPLNDSALEKIKGRSPLVAAADFNGDVKT